MLKVFVNQEMKGQYEEINTGCSFTEHLHSTIQNYDINNKKYYKTLFRIQSFWPFENLNYKSKNVNNIKNLNKVVFNSNHIKQSQKERNK